MSEFKEALKEFHKAFRLHELWLTLGWRDVLTKYRRSLLGPIWITLSMLIIAGVLGTLYSAIMKRPINEYIPYLTVGFIAWNLISSLIVEGTQAFVSNAAAIKEMPIANSVYVFRIVWRNTIVFGYNFVVYLLLLIVFKISPFPVAFLALPAFIIILLNGLWVGLLFGLLNAKIRDFSQLINNLMRLIFFVTPIVWHAELATGIRGLFVQLNPFYYFIEILRAPMLGTLPNKEVWIVVGAMTVVGWLIALPTYMHFRKKIIFWV